MYGEKVVLVLKGSYDYGIADAISIGAGVGIYSEGKTVDGNKKPLYLYTHVLIII